MVFHLFYRYTVLSLSNRQCVLVNIDFVAATCFVHIIIMDKFSIQTLVYAPKM